jgi:peptidoglycan/LPS O-acetylase OafA/YrhL
VAFAVGAVYGLAGTIAHAYRWGWLPLGLLLAVIGSVALLIAVRLLTGDRWTALATGLGMLIATVVFSGRGPGGSVIVPQTELAIAWVIALPIVIVAVVAWPNPRFRPAAADENAPGELG